MADYRKLFAQALEQQQNQSDPMMKQYESELMRQSEAPGLAPTTALIDSYAGTNTTATLPKADSPKERLGNLLNARMGQQKQKLGGLQALAQMQGQAENQAAQRAFQEKMLGLKMLQAKQKGAANNGPRKLSGEDVKAVSQIDQILTHIPNLKSALSKGHQLYPEWATKLKGDNDATRSRRLISEAIGRLQSGGAISKDEEGRFNAMVGALMDSPDQYEAKLGDLIRDFTNRRKNYIYGPSLEFEGAQRGTAGSSPVANMDIDGMSEAELDMALSMYGGT